MNLGDFTQAYYKTVKYYHIIGPFIYRKTIKNYMNYLYVVEGTPWEILNYDFTKTPNRWSLSFKTDKPSEDEISFIWSKIFRDIRRMYKRI